MARIAWHPTFVQAIAIELADYRDVLTFESEHQLTTEPLKIDVLIIKKVKNVVIEKNIARIFRTFNVVEYKSPNDHVSVADYHKTQCYSRLYATLNNGDTEDISVTIVATRHPRKLLAFLKRRYQVQKVQSGIYYIDGDTSPTQIIVSEELSETDNLWLNSLRNDLTIAQLERFTKVPERDLPLDVYMHVIGEANAEEMEEMFMRKKNGVIFTEKIDAFLKEKYGPEYIARGIVIGKAEGMAKGMAEGMAEGKAEMLLNVLRAKFKKVPKETEKIILAMTDSIALDSWGVHAATCSTMQEFSAAIK